MIQVINLFKVKDIHDTKVVKLNEDFRPHALELPVSAPSDTIMFIGDTGKPPGISMVKTCCVIGIQGLRQTVEKFC